MEEQKNVNQGTLFNHLVLENVFSRLRLRELKACRLVCPNWNSIATGYLDDISAVSLRSSSLATFNHNFPRSTSVFPFTNFSFEGAFQAQDLETFFHNWRDRVKGLSLSHVTLADSDGQRMPMYDISKWADLQLNSLKMDACDLVVPLSYVRGIRRLFVRGTGVTVLLDGRIAPTHLHLQPKQFMCCGDGGPRRLVKKNSVFNMNEWVDVRNLVQLCVKIEVRSFLIARMDLTHCRKLERLAFFGGELNCWHTKLRLKRLTTYGVPLDVAQLPPSLTQLTVWDKGYNLEYISDANFPHLKSLCVGDIPLLSQCPNLRRVIVKKFRFNLNTLPPRLDTIVLHKFSVTETREFVGHWDGELHYLVLDLAVMPWEYIRYVIDVFRPKTVVVNWLVLWLSNVDPDTLTNEIVNTVLLLVGNGCKFLVNNPIEFRCDRFGKRDYFRNKLREKETKVLCNNRLRGLGVPYKLSENKKSLDWEFKERHEWLNTFY